MPSNEHGQPVGDLLAGWTPRRLPERDTLVGRHVTAEPIGTRHTDALYASLCRPDDDALWTYRTVARPQTREQLVDTIVRPLSEHPASATYAFVPVGGEAAGLATFFPCVTTSGVVEISGVLLSRHLQRTTAATEAIHLMIRHAVDDLGYRRVEWKCDSLNEPSRRAAQRLGFTYEGRFRQHMVTKDRSRDTDWFSIIDGEWPALRARHQQWLDPANFDDEGRQHRRLDEL